MTLTDQAINSESPPIKRVKDKKATFPCDYCPHNISCGNIFTALKIIQSMADKPGVSPELKKQVIHWKSHLKRLGYAYGESNESNHCLLAHLKDKGQDLELVNIGQKLISELRKSVNS